MNALEKFNLLSSGRLALVEPYKAKVEDIQLVHDATYIERVRKLVEAGHRYLDVDTYLSPHSFDVALLAAGGVVKACDLVLEGGYSNVFALVRPPGHHAGIYGRALGAPSQGFCIFNNVAVGASYLINRRGLSRVLILDIDCHHGNGTQEVFYELNKVLYISLHQDPYTLYPGTGFIDEVGVSDGRGYNVNLPMAPNSGDDAYMKAWIEIVEPIATQFKPELVFMSVGYDAHYDDPVTMMNLSTRGYIDLFNKALELASSTCRGRFVAVLEGGYGRFLAESAAATIATMADINLPLGFKRTTSSREVIKRIESIILKLKEYLKDVWSFK